MRQVIIVTGLGFGDESKGGTVDFLTRQYKAHTVVRHNGGGNAGHNVVLPNGVHHTFSHFGSGTFAGAKTYLSKHMIVEPLGLIAEAEHLIKCGISNPWELMAIDKGCKLATPYHRYTNRALERRRGGSRHGSCGMGIGQVMDDYVNHNTALYVEDLFNHSCFSKSVELSKIHAKKLGNSDVIDLEPEVFAFFEATKFLMEQGVFASDEHFQNIINKDGTIIFEGAQGVLLDEWHGFHPYTTWSTTTAHNAQSLLMENDYLGKVTKLGLIRSYMTRHGPGPFPTYDRSNYAEKHNQFGEWQREFCFGALDLPLIKYAIAANDGINNLCVSHLDQMGDTIDVCVDYENKSMEYLKVTAGRDESKLMIQKLMGQFYSDAVPRILKVNKSNFIEFLEKELKTKVILTSNGPTYLDKNWYGK